MDRRELERIKALLISRGIYKTDQQIINYYKEEEDPSVADLQLPKIPHWTPSPQDQPVKITPSGKPSTTPPGTPLGAMGEGSTVTENVLDFVGSALWQGIDVTTFGLAGYGFKAAAPELYKSMEEELSDTLGGRIGGGVGMAAGFLLPMGWASRGVKLATGAVTRGGAKLGVKGFGKVAEQTTRGLQKQAAEKLAKRAGMKPNAARDVIKNISDDIVGFTPTGATRKGKLWGHIRGTAPAHQLEGAGVEMIKGIKETMKFQLPDRLAAKLTDAGIQFNKKQLIGMTDEIVEILGKAPINSLENIIASKFSGRWLPHIMRATTSIAQEGASMGMVMTSMDYVQHKKGVPTLAGDEDWGDRFLKHALFGAGLGLISHAIPGGRSATWGWFNKKGDIWKALGRTSSRLNKQVGKMNAKETKAWAWTTMNTNSAFRPRMDGRAVTRAELLNPSTFKSAAEIKVLKQSLFNANNKLLREFRKGVDSTKGKGIRQELLRDIWRSSPRYITGAYWMSHESIREYGLTNVIQDPEMAFHLWLGAFMTKRGRNFIHGRKQKFLGLDIGEKPYYFNEVVAKQVRQMDRAIGNSENIGKITKQFDGYTYSMMQDKAINPDVDKVLKTLEDHGILYTEESKDLKKLKTDPDLKDPIHSPNRELLNFISPLDGIIKIRGYKINKNASPVQQINALKAVRNTPSEVLSTPDNTIHLTDPNTIIHSQEMAVHREWLKVGSDMLDVYKNIMTIVSDGDREFVKGDGDTWKYRLIPPGENTARSLTTDQEMIVNKIHDLREDLNRTDYIFEKQRPFQGSDMFEFGRGWTQEVWNSKLEQIAKIQSVWEANLGKEYWGFTTGDPQPHAGPDAWDIWHHISTAKHVTNIRNVYDVLVGNKTDYIGGDPIRWTKIQNAIVKLLRPSESETDGRIIVDSPRRFFEVRPDGKSPLDPDSVVKARELGDYDKLTSFMKALWQINTTTKKAEGMEKNEVINLNDVRDLYEMVTANDVGFPTAEFSDLRMDNYLYKMADWGIEKRIGGLGANRAQTYILAKGMEVGLFKNAGTDEFQGYGIDAGRELSVKSIQDMFSISKDGAQHYVKAWQNILDNLKGMVNTRTDISMKQLTADQLSFIYSSEVLLRPESLDSIQEVMTGRLIGMTEAVNEQIAGLRSELQNTGSAIPTVGVEGMEPLNLIKARIKDKQNTLRYLDEFNQIFIGSITGKGLHRAAAFVNYIERSKLFDKLNGVVEAKTPEAFKAITDEIKKVQRKIAEDFSNTLVESADVFTLHREENIIRERTEEIEGRSHRENKIRVTPDTFFQEYELNTESFTNGRHVPAITYENNSQILQKLYDNTVKNREAFPEERDGLLAFRDEIYRVAGYEQPLPERRLRGVVWKENGNFKYESPTGVGTVRTADYPNEQAAHYSAQLKSSSEWTEAALREPDSRIKNQVVRLFNTFERQVHVKSISVVGDHGNWTDKNISKGPLPDLYNEVFGERGFDIVLFDKEYIDRDGKIQFFDGVDQGTFSHVIETLANPEFRAAQRAGGSKIKRMMGQAIHEAPKGIVDPEMIPYQKEELTRMIEGSHYMIPVDENIRLLMSRDQFSPLAERFFEWYTDYRTSDYVNSFRTNDPDGRAMSHIRNLDTILSQLEQSRLTEGEQINRPGEVFAVESIEGASGTRNAEALSSTMYKMWDSMYSQRINGDWLTDMMVGPDKWLKYKRLAQNIGYNRNSAMRRQFLLETWGNDYGYYGDIVRRYAGPEKDILESFAIDDSNLSVKGQDANGLVTDNRSAAEWSARQQHAAGRIGDIQLQTMLNFYKNESNFINAEQSNAATAVRRERLDYLLLLDGQSDIIGESAGQKPVGFSSYTDANGTIHTFLNKTHYFYNSHFDRFFEKNPNTDELSLKSGLKHSGRVRTGAGISNIQEFRAYSDIPTIESLEVQYKAEEDYFRMPVPRNYFANWVNNIRVADHPEAILYMDANQMVSGTTYGTPHEAKVTKQFGNWGDKNIQAQLYEAYRSDAADRFADKAMSLYDVMNTRLLSDEMRSIIQSRDQGTMDAINTQTDNASTAVLWIEGGGPPLDPIAKSFTDNQMKKKYIIDAGIMDGFTTSGGLSVIRNNVDLNLEVPSYVPNGDGTNRQVTLGEGNIGQAYLRGDILFDGDYAINRTKVPGIVPREKLKNATTQTISFRHNKYDYLINMKTLEVFDPMSREGDPYLALKDTPFSDNVKERIENLRRIMGQDITTWGQFVSEIRNVMNEGLPQGEGFNLVATFLRPPRIGSHDLVVERVRNSIVERDGGLSEHNPHDGPLKSMSDFDTDKGNSLFDLPFDIAVHAYRENGKVMEPGLLQRKDKNMFDYDPTDWRSTMNQYGRINNYGRKRGHVVKTPRKLTFGQLLLKEIDGLKIGGHDIVFNDSHQGKKKTATDNMNVLDIYKGFAKNLTNMPNWFNETYFTGEHPFFKLRVKGADGKFSYKNISLEKNPVEVNVVYKILSDFGKLLTLEGNIYEAGEPKTPRYTDFIARKRDFSREYSTRDNRINFNFYNYLVARGLESKANELFYDNDARRMKNKDINDIMGPIGRGVKTNLTTFDKALEAITSRDWLEAQEMKRAEGDSFSDTIDRLVSQHRGELLKYFEVSGERPTEVKPWDIDSIMRQEWDAINEFRNAEKSLAQTTILEEQIRRLEKVISDDGRRKGMDEQDLKYYTDNITLKKELLTTILGKISMEPDFNKGYGNQDFITQKKIKPNKEKRHIWYAKGGEVVRNQSGKFVKSLKKGDEYTVRSNEVVVINPVEIVPVTTNEMISGLVHAKTVLGAYSQIVGGKDAKQFTKIQNQTRNKINSYTYNFIQKKGLRDWTKHEVEVQAIVDDGLRRIAELAGEDLPSRGQYKDTLVGKLPHEKAEYPKIFLLGLLAYGDSGNRVHYMKNSNQIVEAVRVPSSTVIRSVFDAIKSYGVVTNYRDFVTNYAKDARAWHDALVQNEGFDRAFRELNNSELGYSLAASSIQSASNTPFLPKEQYKSMTRYMEMKDAIGSEFAELFTQIITDRVAVDPITAKLLKDKFISENENGWEKFKNLFLVSRGHLYFDGINLNQFGLGRGEGMYLGEMVGPDPGITKNIITGSKRTPKNSRLDEFIDTVTGEANVTKITKNGQTEKICGGP